MSFLSGVDPDVPRVIAVVTSDEVGDQLEARLAESGVTLRRHQVGRLAEADLSALASAVLSGSATPRLLAELKDQSDLLAGRAVTILRDWIASGWIISTINGLDLFTDPPAFGGVSPVGDYFRTTLEQMTLAETEFCQLLAMIDRPVSAMMLRNLSAADPDGPTGLDTLQSLLDELADLGVLRIGTAGYEFRNRAIRDAFEHRLRPSVKARLLRRVGQDFREETNA
jgi:hypothetical protein